MGTLAVSFFHELISWHVLMSAHGMVVSALHILYCGMERNGMGSEGMIAPRSSSTRTESKKNKIN
ncbi:hypothetical protein K440DRAFT_28727 [Wilcoxina mikolae CBS 423.85]|nr:hypothetical protein K440DRAFT_28727 [Wilcoxina mikolae CBS 423.85]